MNSLSTIPWDHRVLVVWCAVLCLSLSACNREEGIRQYTVEKAEESDKVDVPEGTNLAWFFKFSGPAGKITEQQLREFGELLRTVTLVPGKAPQYSLPEGWTEEPGTPPRFKTLKIPNSDPPLEVTVNYLPAEDPNSREYLQVNYNRWRTQLGLATDTSETWYETAEKNEELAQVTNGRQTFTLASLLGTTEEHGETLMRVVMITAGASPDLLAKQREAMGESSSSSGSSGSGSSGFQSEKPETWEEAARNQFAVATYSAKNEAGTVDITVSPVGGSALANINRWCGQVGLPNMSESEYAKTSSTIEISGTPGTFVNLVGEESSIIGAVVVHKGQQWFFKGRGPTAAVALEVERFKAYLGSVRFE